MMMMTTTVYNTECSTVQILTCNGIVVHACKRWRCCCTCFFAFFFMLFSQMYCGDGKSSSMATLWFQAPEASVRSLFHDEYGRC